MRKSEHPLGRADDCLLGRLRGRGCLAVLPRSWSHSGRMDSRHHLATWNLLRAEHRVRTLPTLLLTQWFYPVGAGPRGGLRQELLVETSYRAAIRTRSSAIPSNSLREGGGREAAVCDRGDVGRVLRVAQGSRRIRRGGPRGKSRVRCRPPKRLLRTNLKGVRFDCASYINAAAGAADTRIPKFRMPRSRERPPSR